MRESTMEPTAGSMQEPTQPGAQVTIRARHTLTELDEGETRTVAHTRYVQRLIDKGHVDLVEDLGADVADVTAVDEGVLSPAADVAAATDQAEEEEPATSTGKKPRATRARADRAPEEEEPATSADKDG